MEELKKITALKIIEKGKVEGYLKRCPYNSKKIEIMERSIRTCVSILESHCQTVRRVYDPEKYTFDGVCSFLKDAMGDYKITLKVVKNFLKTNSIIAAWNSLTMREKMTYIQKTLFDNFKEDFWEAAE